MEHEAVKKLADQLAERMVGGFRAHEFLRADSCDACGMSGLEAAQYGIGCPGRASLAWLYDLPRHGGT